MQPRFRSRLNVMRNVPLHSFKRNIVRFTTDYISINTIYFLSVKELMQRFYRASKSIYTNLTCSLIIVKKTTTKIQDTIKANFKRQKTPIKIKSYNINSTVNIKGTWIIHVVSTVLGLNVVVQSRNGVWIKALQQSAASAPGSLKAGVQRSAGCNWSSSRCLTFWRHWEVKMSLGSEGFLFVNLCPILLIPDELSSQ